MKSCTLCNKDHKEPNIGELTICERREYFKQGVVGKVNNEKVRGFGIGKERFQLRD